MAVTWTKSLITRKRVWKDGLFTITVDAPNVFPFTAGQFLQLGLVDEENHIHRPYSVASPHGTELEFYIVLVEDGELTPLLWALNEGDSLDVSERAAGRFTLERAPDADNLWLVATGTGLAPYIAMLRTEEPWERYQRICVVHGVRHEQDLSYQDELCAYGEQYPGRFAYVPATTRDEFSTGLQGRIPSLFEEGSLEEFAETSLTSTDSTILLCGNPAMLDDMELQLERRGMKRHRSRAPGQIVVERYW